MDYSVFFSIIVPVYKVEPYLRRCVESVLNQSFTDFELILVDDGSPDNCPKMCDEYSRSDKRVRVIHKDNGGVSSARNAALHVAQGKYISFLDSDDFWIDDTALEAIYVSINENQPEIVVLKSVNYYQSSEAFSSNFNTLSSNDLLLDNYEGNFKKLILASAFRACAWDKVFLRELMERRDLYFTEGIIAEDVDWAARLCLAAKSITILDTPVYGYRLGRPGSITSSLTIKNLRDTRDSILRCIHYVEGQKLTEQFLFAYYSYVAYRYVIWMAESYLVKDMNKKLLVEEMKKKAWLLEYDEIKRVKKARLLYCFLGFQGASMVLGMYLKRKHARRRKHGNTYYLHANI